MLNRNNKKDTCLKLIYSNYCKIGVSVKSALVFHYNYVGKRIADVAIPSLSDGTTVYVEYTTPSIGRISINLVQDEQNVPLQVDVRYHWFEKVKVLVLNSLKNGVWQTEEHPTGFPFNSGYLTTVKIVPSSEASAYKIYANGKHIADFVYRSGGTPDLVTSLLVISDEVSQPVQATHLMVI